MVVPPAPARDAGVTNSLPDASSSSAGFRTALVGLLVLGMLIGAGVLIWMVAQRQGSGEDQAQREELMSQTEQFMLRMGTYGPDLLDDNEQMPEYRSRMKEVITDKFSVSFDKEVTTAEQLVVQAGVARKAAVFATGVSTMDEDSATTLVAGTFTDSYIRDGETIPRDPIPFRLEVSLVLTGGKWLIDDFTPVSGSEESP